MSESGKFLRGKERNIYLHRISPHGFLKALDELRNDQKQIEEYCQTNRTGPDTAFTLKPNNKPEEIKP